MIINLDVDGVLYPSLPLHEYAEEGCFEIYSPKEGKATVAFVDKIRELIKGKGDVIFLTKTCSISQNLHDAHTLEKRRWLKKWFNAKDSEIIVLRSDEHKNDYSHGILVDDYGQNCMKWEEDDGCISIQFGEAKKKSWLTAETYNETIKILEAILSEVL